MEEHIVMKKIGIIGGIGPESTADYYKLIINTIHQRQGNTEYPEIFIYSVNISDLMRLMEGGDPGKLTNWILEKIEVIYKAGAEFAVMASNSPHIVFENIRAKSPIPLLSIVEETAKTAQKRGLKKLGLLGTKFTMESNFYADVFRKMNMDIFVPEKEDRDIIHHRLFTEIELGIIKNSTRKELLSIVKKMINLHSINAVVLGCTELPLILTKDEFGIPFLNTAAIHVESIVNYCLYHN
jgi:aspartate racemase